MGPASGRKIPLWLVLLIVGLLAVTAWLTFSLRSASSVEGMREMLDRAAVPDAAVLIREYVSGQGRPLFGEELTLERVYASTETPEAACEEIPAIVAPLGPVLSRSSKRDGSLPTESTYECLMSGRVESSKQEMYYYVGVQVVSAYKQLLLTRSETAHFADRIPVASLSTFHFDVRVPSD